MSLARSLKISRVSKLLMGRSLSSNSVNRDFAESWRTARKRKDVEHGSMSQIKESIEKLFNELELNGDYEESWRTATVKSIKNMIDLIEKGKHEQKLKDLKDKSVSQIKEGIEKALKHPFNVLERREKLEVYFTGDRDAAEGMKELLSSSNSPIEQCIPKGTVLICHEYRGEDDDNYNANMYDFWFGVSLKLK